MKLTFILLLGACFSGVLTGCGGSDNSGVQPPSYDYNQDAPQTESTQLNIPTDSSGESAWLSENATVSGKIKICQ